MIAKMSQLPEMMRQNPDLGSGHRDGQPRPDRHRHRTGHLLLRPHSPWQRGTSENTNGLLREYFPKGSDLSFWGPGYLDYVAAELNNRPRKRLGWRTPAEALDELLSNPTNPPSVAMTA